MSSVSRYPFGQISASELAARLPQEQEQLQLIDVREPEEIAIASVAGFEILPLSQFEQWSSQIHSRFDLDKETIVMCHHGVRSAQMCQWLVSQGFTHVNNLVGGIEAYSVDVDPSIPRY